MNGRELFAKLKEQQFRIEDTSDGWMIKAPDGEGSTSFHKSRFFLTESVKDSVLANLKNIGFNPNHTTKKEIDKKPWDDDPEGLCPECLENGEYKYFNTKGPRGKQPLGSHRARAHGYRADEIKVKDEEFLDVGERRKRGKVTTRRQEPESPAVRVQLAVKRFRKAAKTMVEQVEIIEKEVTGMEEELTDKRRKLKKVEDLLGRAVDNL